MFSVLFREYSPQGTRALNMEFMLEIYSHHIFIQMKDKFLDRTEI